MDSDFKEIFNKILALPMEDRLDLVEFTYKQLRDDFFQFEPKVHGLGLVGLVLVSSAAANGTVTYSERCAVRRVLEIEGISLDDEDLRKFFEEGLKNQSFDVVISFAKKLEAEKRALLFTLVTAISACDGEIDEHEYDFLIDIITA